MGIKYVSLRDVNGHQSSIGIYDGEGSIPESVGIVGVIPHGATYSFKEFDWFAISYLAERGYDLTSALHDSADEPTPDAALIDLDPDDVQGGNGPDPTVTAAELTPGPGGDAYLAGIMARADGDEVKS